MAASVPWFSEAAKTHRVVIRGLKYQPESLVVRRGDAVVWVNDDPMPHTVTAAGDLCDAVGEVRVGHVAPKPLQFAQDDGPPWGYKYIS